MTPYCNHQFVLVKTDVEYIDESQEHSTSTAKIKTEKPNSIHAVVVCSWCGHVRHVYADGTIKIIKEHGETTNKEL